MHHSETVIRPQMEVPVRHELRHPLRHIAVAHVAVRQDYAASRHMLLYDRDQCRHLFVTDAVKYSDVGGPTVDAEHPAYVVAFTMNLVLAMIDLAFVDLYDAGEL